VAETHGATAEVPTPAAGAHLTTAVPPAVAEIYVATAEVPAGLVNVPVATSEAFLPVDEVRLWQQQRFLQQVQRLTHCKATAEVHVAIE
jgi:hypothetical protein